MKRIIDPALRGIRKHSVLTEIVLIGFAALAYVSSAAFAAPFQGEPRTVRVSYADLDLSKRSDSAALTRRLHAAAAEVCRTPPTAARSPARTARSRTPPAQRATRTR
ncbi:MAG: UrcA family protein [Gammaproteobacteria bacterium]